MNTMSRIHTVTSELYLADPDVRVIIINRYIFTFLLMEKRNRFALKLQVPTDEDKHIILNNFQNTTGSTI